MFGDTLFWLGLLGLVSGIMVGISLLEDSDSFVRNVMFAIGIVVVMFVFLLQLGETKLGFIQMELAQRYKKSEEDGKSGECEVLFGLHYKTAMFGNSDESREFPSQCSKRPKKWAAS